MKRSRPRGCANGLLLSDGLIYVYSSDGGEGLNESPKYGFADLGENNGVLMITECGVWVRIFHVGCHVQLISSGLVTQLSPFPNARCTTIGKR